MVRLFRGSSPRPIIEYLTTDNEEGVNWVKIGDVPTSGRIITSTEEKITKEGAKKSRHVYVGDLILSNSMSYGLPYIMGIEGCIHDGWFVLRDYEQNFNKDYLCNLLISDIVQKQYKKIAAGGVVQNISSDLVNSVYISIPSLDEQRKIAGLLSLIDERIATQNKIIEDLKKLKYAIIEREYTFKVQTHSHIGDFIEQNSNRNKDNIIQNVLSVSNRQGFIRQREQFEDRSIASNDTSNYKIVTRNDFAFNPARINVGSIARLTTFEKGIVSPMYICFHTKNSILPEYLSFYFETKQFFSEIQKRLEGSVRQCLSYEGLCNIPFFPPVIEDQRRIGKRLFTLVQKFNLEMTFLEMLQKQKTYLLRQMFI